MNSLLIEILQGTGKLLLGIFMGVFIVSLISDTYNKLVVFRKIPGENGLPLVGILPIVIWRKMTLQSYINYCYKKYGKTFKIFLLNDCRVYVGDANDIRNLNTLCMDRNDMRRAMGPQNYDNSRDLHGLFFSRQPLWRELRAQWQHGFSPKMLHRYFQIMKQHLALLSDEIDSQNNKTINIFDNFNQFTLGIILECGVGLKLVNGPKTANNEDSKSFDYLRKQFNFLQNSMGQISIFKMVPLTFGVFAQPIRFISEYILQDQNAKTYKQLNYNITGELSRIRQRNQEASDQDVQNSIQSNGKENGHGEQDLSIDNQDYQNLVDQMKFWKLGGTPVKDWQIAANLITLVFAGHDTTMSFLSWTVYNLTQNQEAESKLRQEIQSNYKGLDITLEDLEKYPYMRACLEESLRVNSVAFLSPRQTHKDIYYRDYYLPKGCSVVFLIQHPQVDSNIWEDPFKYVPERFMGEERQKSLQKHFAPFGYGARMCIGRNFAMQEAMLTFIELYSKFSFELAQDKEIVRQYGITVRPKGGVNVKVHKIDKI